MRRLCAVEEGRLDTAPSESFFFFFFFPLFHTLLATLRSPKVRSHRRPYRFHRSNHATCVPLHFLLPPQNNHLQYLNSPLPLPRPPPGLTRGHVQNFAFDNMLLSKPSQILIKSIARYLAYSLDDVTV